MRPLQGGRSLLAVAALALTAGCGTLNLGTDAGEADRVLTGTVEFRAPTADSAMAVQLPPGCSLVVRVIDPNPPQTATPLQTSSEMAAARQAPTPVTVGESTLRDLGDAPFVYRVEYSASDDDLRRGLQLEARITTADGHLIYSNTDSFSVGLNDAGEPHRIVLDKIGR
jgi:uncharacterized lipoprotein YbaY